MRPPIVTVPRVDDRVGLLAQLLVRRVRVGEQQVKQRVVVGLVVEADHWCLHIGDPVEPLHQQLSIVPILADLIHIVPITEQRGHADGEDVGQAFFVIDECIVEGDIGHTSPNRRISRNMARLFHHDHRRQIFHLL